MKSNSGTKVLHNRHVHPTGFHLLIFCLNSLRLGVYDISRYQLPRYWTSISCATPFPNKLFDNF